MLPGLLQIASRQGGFGHGARGTADAAGTQMMCDEALMEQERMFLAALGARQSFSIAADGALLLQTSDGRNSKARRC